MVVNRVGLHGTHGFTQTLYWVSMKVPTKYQCLPSFCTLLPMLSPIFRGQYSTGDHELSSFMESEASKRTQTQKSDHVRPVELSMCENKSNTGRQPERRNREQKNTQSPKTGSLDRTHFEPRNCRSDTSDTSDQYREPLWSSRPRLSDRPPKV